MKLQGKVAVVTGAARGIGFACARRFAEDGASVVLSDVDEGGVNAACATLTSEGHTAFAVRADVSVIADVDSLVAATVTRFGRIDIMLNNAGIAITKDFMSVTPEDYDRVLAINLRGAFFGVQAAARAMIAAGNGGVILNMSSINSRMANPSVATYAISKGGLNQVTGTAAIALAPHGIRVCGIGPGTIATEMLNMGFLTNEEQRLMILSRTPAGRLGDPSEVASVAAFLASDDASYMTGQTVYPDGGRMILNYVVPVADNA
jgi:NAD(P)-dependent dehydrogenase (short-subunit alcohol dehydrogenase family)